jgi:hypothetical protein
MSLKGKVIAGALIGTGIYAGYSYYLKMKKTQAELEVVPDASIDSINLNGITIRLDLLLKNPTKGSFKMKFPFIKIKYKDTLIGSSQVVDKDITIPAFGQAKIDKILVNIPILSIFSIGMSLMKAIKDKQDVKVTATFISSIDLGWTNLPYEESHEVTLKKK